MAQLTLSQPNTNTGAVTVNGGTLALNGAASFANASRIIVGAGGVYDLSGVGGVMTLNIGQTLGGSGTVNGSVTASAGSIVSPGTSIGTLNISGDLTLSGTLLMELNRTNGLQTNDLITVGCTFSSAGGSLVVSNSGPVLAAGNFFQLFSAAGASLL